MQYLDSGHPINCAIPNRYNDYRKKLEADVLALSVPLPQISMVSHTPLPVAKQKTFVPAEPGTGLPPFPFIVNPDMSIFFFIWIYYFTLFHILKISPDTLTPLSTGGHCWLVDGVACREDFLSSLSPNRLLSLSSEEITGGQWGLRNFMFFFSFSVLWTRKLVLSRSLESLCRNFSRRSCSLFEITGGQLCFLGIIIKCTITLWRKQILNQIGWLTSQIVGPQHLYSGRWVGSRCTGRAIQGPTVGGVKVHRVGGIQGPTEKIVLHHRETDLRVNVANCFTKSSPPPSPHWPANKLFQTLRAPIGRRDDLFRQVPPGHPRPIGRRTNCFRRSALPLAGQRIVSDAQFFGLEQYLKTAIFHTIFTHCWLSILSDFIRAFCFRVFLLFFNIDHLFHANVSQPILHVLMLYLSWFWKR